MTEKRFSMTETELIFMVLDNGNALSRKEIVDKLNDFNDENKHLKEIMGIMSNDNVNDIVNVLNCQERIKQKLQKENEQLKQENIELKSKASSWKITASEEISEKGELIKQIGELKEENRLLRKAAENLEDTDWSEE